MTGQVWTILNTLTPGQRTVIRSAVGMCTLWQPLTGNEAQAARRLARVGVLERVGAGEYALTSLGERVAAQVRPRR